MRVKLTIADLCSGERRFVRFGARLMGYKDFANSDSGVVTIEWVALAAGLVAGCLVISFIIMNGLVAVASNVASQLSP